MSCHGYRYSSEHGFGPVFDKAEVNPTGYDPYQFRT